MQKRRVQIFGKYYMLKFVTNLGKYLGHCDHPEAPQKEIRIKRGQPPKEELDTTIHEVSHAADFSKSESWICVFSRDLTEILWSLGYRRLTKEEIKTWEQNHP